LPEGDVAAMGSAKTATAEVGARGLIYPLGDPPAPGMAVEAAPGVLWMRLPMFMPLNHVNVYAIADGDGWALIDTGLNNAVTIEAWQTMLAGPLGGRPVHRVFGTHMHPDHVGLAGWLCEQTGAALWMSRLEYLTCRVLVADTGKPAPAEGVSFYQACGWNRAQIARYTAEFGGFGRGVWPLPQSYNRLSEGDQITIGDDAWTIVVGSGHSPEHVCLWRKSDGVFISGDQILPRISSNVSVWPTEPNQDPLDDWMRSLHRLRDLLPSDLLILPGHGDPFRGVTTRIDALVRGHETSLKRLERTLRKPCRAIDVFPSLFARPVGDAVFGMATGESVAHLNYLEGQGRARRERDENGVDWWSSTATEDQDTADTQETEIQA